MSHAREQFPSDDSIIVNDSGGQGSVETRQDNDFHVWIYWWIFFCQITTHNTNSLLEPISASSGEGWVTLDKSPVHHRADI